MRAMFGKFRAFAGREAGDEPYPSEGPYILLWGGVDYTVTGREDDGWGFVSAHAATDLTLDIVPIPEPANLVLLAIGGLLLVRRRR